MATIWWKSNKQNSLHHEWDRGILKNEKQRQRGKRYMSYRVNLPICWHLPGLTCSESISCASDITQCYAESDGLSQRDSQAVNQRWPFNGTKRLLFSIFFSPHLMEWLDLKNHNLTNLIQHFCGSWKMTVWITSWGYPILSGWTCQMPS